MNVKSLRVLSCTALLAVAACGDSGTEVDLGDLTESEAAALVEAVSATVYTSTSSFTPGPQAVGPQGAPFSLSDEVSGEIPCALGGTVSVAGSLDYSGDDETGEAEASFTLTQTHHDCVAESDNGLRFTLNGAPQISTQVLLQMAEDAVSFDGGYTGAIDWATDGREGTCPVNVEFAMAFGAGAESGSATVSGTVCGLSISRSLTFG